MAKYSCTVEQLNAGLDVEAARMGPVRRDNLTCAGCGRPISRFKVHHNNGRCYRCKPRGFARIGAMVAMAAGFAVPCVLLAHAWGAL